MRVIPIILFLCTLTGFWPQSARAVGGVRDESVLESVDDGSAHRALSRRSNMEERAANGRVANGRVGGTGALGRTPNISVHRRLATRTGEPKVPAASTQEETSYGPDAATEDRDEASKSFVAAGSSAGSVEAVKLDEVIVTAQKFSERALDVPISLAVVGGTQLQELKVVNLDDLDRVVPGLTVEDGETTLRIAIRGISNTFGTGALVGSYLDEADVTADGSLGLNLNTYDLQRIEVLRGPQGTLYGAGSIGGTIRYITNKPNLNQFQMTADVAAQFDQYGAPGQRVQSAVNAPVVPGTLGIRVAGNFEHEGGWIDQPSADLRNINTKDIADARIQGLWRPGGQLQIAATQVIHRGTLGNDVGEDVDGNFTQPFNLTTTPVTHDSYGISNLTIAWNGAHVDVLNSATYFNHTLKQLDRGATYQFSAPPAPRINYYVPRLEVVDKAFSDELRVSNARAGKWLWTVGSLYRVYKSAIEPEVYYYALPGPPGTPLPKPFSFSQSSRSESLSGFGDTSFLLIGGLRIGGGVRYFRDDEKFMGAPGSTAQSGRFTSVDPRAYLQYRITRDFNVYASAAKGFRSGGFNSLGQPKYKPEAVWTYELGSKLSTFDHRMAANADVFFSNYSGYQIVGIAPPPAQPLNITHNAGTARIKGIESDVSWRPSDEWQLRISGDYINARFVNINVLDSSHEVGDPLDMFPRYQVTAAIERDFSWNGRDGFTSVDYSQRAPEQFRNRSIGPWYYSQSSYIYLLNFNTGIQWDPSLRFGFFVQNLLNDRGYTGAFVIEQNAAREQPRTFGLDFSVALE